ncbi:predicted protein [Streptomyces viridosporus ATCC 14672]|uniref:Predicted protein n=1 Tax=Streptomyces viridosporus (strain ATCC 14672 / DSM 40746 / JCM 4963 / KCTC 9882 / NRRL B-12104 / FH 1290) TaxID=566461 RepID=D5ZR05_STRV1|nr:predicted protein [Streptomyces viridosporus ATCC 14672]
MAKRPPAVLGRIACAMGHLLRKAAHRSAVHTRCVQIDGQPGRISTGSRCVGTLYRPHRCPSGQRRPRRRDRTTVRPGRPGRPPTDPDCQWRLLY